MLEIQDQPIEALPATERLEVLHGAVMSNIQLYASGLITLPELFAEMAHLSTKLGDVSGFADPASGLPL